MFSSSSSLSTSLLVHVLIFLFSLDEACALTLPLTARQRLGHESFTHSHGGVLGDASSSNGAGLVSLRNDRDLYYYTDLTIAGERVTDILVDTGSADLWIQGSVAGGKDTDTWIEMKYDVGAARGSVKMAEVELNGLVVPEQAYMEVSSEQNTFGTKGILGLGPSSLSTIHTTMENGNTRDSTFSTSSASSASSASFLDNFFQQHPSISPYITTFLSRSSHYTSVPQHSSALTIGEIVPGFEAVLTAPKLLLEPETPWVGQQWTVLLDSWGLRVNGALVPLPQSVVEQSTSSDRTQLTVLLDTGFSFNQVPRVVADMMYAGIEGAWFDESGRDGLWHVPCAAEIELSLSFGGVEYPVHPLDAILDLNSGSGQSDGWCVGSFQPFMFDTANTTDMILGMAFLRSVYVLSYYGNLVSGRSEDDVPYVQMLSTAPGKGRIHAEFVKERLGVDGDVKDGDEEDVRLEEMENIMGASIAQSPAWEWRWLLLANIGVALFMALGSGLSWIPR